MEGHQAKKRPAPEINDGVSYYRFFGSTDESKMSYCGSRNLSVDLVL